MTWVPIHVFTVLNRTIKSPISTFRHIICKLLPVLHHNTRWWIISHITVQWSYYLFISYLWSIWWKYRLLLRILWEKVIASDWCRVTAFSIHAVHILMTIHGNDIVELWNGERSCFIPDFFLFGHIISFPLIIPYFFSLIYKNISIHSYGYKIDGVFIRFYLF